MVRRHAGASRTVWALIIVAVLLVGIGETYLISHKSTGAKEIDVTIVETDPVLQTDYFFPANITVAHGQNLQLAVLNGDDNPRVFVMPDYNINLTLSAGQTQRMNLLADHQGRFAFYSPMTPPTAISNGKPGPALDGTLIVT